MDVGELLLLIGGVLAASVLVALGAARVGVPTLVAFLGLGMLLGSDGPGGIAFDNAGLARTIGVVGLVAILYEGGLSTSWRRLRSVAVPAALLSTVGVVATALLAGLAAFYLFGLPWLPALLLGAVVSSTDAAAVFAALRHTRIRRRLARTLEAETGLNDPIAITLTLGLIAWIQQPTYDLGDLVLLFVRQLGLGLVVGVACGAVAAWAFRRLPQAVGSFATVASVAAAAVAFGLAAIMGGSGFLAVYLVGLSVGSTPSRYRRQLVAFHEGLAFLAQVVLFVVLGLLAFPERLATVIGPGLALSVLLVVVVRPIAVWLSTAVVRFTGRERLLLGWAGLRGAAPIVLATFALSSHIGRAETIFDAVFFVVVVSTLLQGTTLEPLARRLGLVDPGPARTAPPIEVDSTGHLDLVEFDVTGDHAIAGATVSQTGLPRGALIAVVVRGGDAIPPRGSTVIEAGDRLYVLVPHTVRPELDDVFTRWRRRV
ncbi:MAG TPA: potassium/proton antiporter [Acidimicrobiales bacterium]|nr:potassium/proton antiporter [Acidimicrobiales bacterium]